MMKKTMKFLTLAIILPFIASCGGNPPASPTPVEPDDGLMFHYEDASFVDEYGSRVNHESHDYNSLIVNPLEGELREDFAFGVDASMTKQVEDAGGVYYNAAGKEQDIFQILRRNGVNFVRFRLWNHPYDSYGNEFGGGNNDVYTDIALAKRAKEANLNVLIDFHYSDFWADPDTQQAPKYPNKAREQNNNWSTLSVSQLPNAISTFTVETLNKFKAEGVTVDAVQIGNETNNGMAGYKIDWNDLETSFNNIAPMFQAGITSAKSVFPNIKTMIHLANGGNAEEFKNYFQALDARGVTYDIIGASYYPHLSGSLDELQFNLNQISELTGKPVIVAETSWGFTTEYIDGVTDNTYNEKDEEVGNYLTSEQAQATCLRDITNVVSKVPNQMGLGIFYWEPGWLPLSGPNEDDPNIIECKTEWATGAGQSYKYTGGYTRRNDYPRGKATWSNQGLFSYTGKALSSLMTYNYLKTGLNPTEEVSTKLRNAEINVTLNLAARETLPATVKLETNLDAVRQYPVVWNEEDVQKVTVKGTHTGLRGVVDGRFNVTCTAKCIENYVVDPGFENQGTTDTVKDPWVIEYVTPVGDKVVKIDRKKDIRSGKSDLNWYHSSSSFSFNVSQKIVLPQGLFTLTTYVMSIEFSKIAHTSLKIYAQIKNGMRLELDICSSDYLKGWNSGYQECVISGINIANDDTEVTIGIMGSAPMEAWAHNDDWELVSNS